MSGALHHCPCCGSPTATRTAAERAWRELPGLQSAMVRRLARDFGGFIATDALIFDLWQGDGEPESARARVSSIMARTNRRLAEHGLRIESRQWHGYRLVAA